MDTYQRIIDSFVSVIVGTQESTRQDYALAGPGK